MGEAAIGFLVGLLMYHVAVKMKARKDAKKKVV